MSAPVRDEVADLRDEVEACPLTREGVDGEGRGGQMGLRELLQAMGRRWYVALVVFALAGAGTAALERDGGLYVTRTVVLFTLPGQASLLPDSGVADASIIGFAASVAETVNGGRPPQMYAAADAPAYGAGVRQGVWIGLPNLGGQWATNYSRAEIEVQIVGRTERWVRETQSRTVAHIVDVADSRQSAAGADDDSRVTASLAPLTSEIEHVLPSRPAQLIAVVAMAAAAVLVSAWASVALDRRLTSSRLTRGRASSRHRGVTA